MAPELAREEDYDSSVDVFSFALILQEVCLFNYSAVLLLIASYLCRRCTVNL